MKKLLSILLSICMLGAFAFTVSADSLASGYTVNIKENKDTVNVDVIASGTFENVTGINLILTYNSSKLKFSKEELNSEIQGHITADNWAASGGDKKYSTATLPDGYYYIGYANKSTTAVKISGTDYRITTVKFDKTSSLVEGDVAAIASYALNKRTTLNTSMKTAADTKATNFGSERITNNFTAYVDTPATPVAPVVETEPAASEGGIVGEISTAANAEDNTKFDWTLPVVAPIGKTVKVTDGTSNFFVGKDGKVAGTSASGAKLAVTFEDNTDSVITYVLPIADIYGDADGIAAFGKGTIAADDEYGIKFTGLDLTNSSHKDGKFPAKWNADGIFAVEIKNAPKGEYSAQAYIGDATGAVVEFSK